jgi:hypothetical protein
MFYEGQLFLTKFRIFLTKFRIFLTKFRIFLTFLTLLVLPVQLGDQRRSERGKKEGRMNA